jgi:HlyD family secretion protein
MNTAVTATAFPLRRFIIWGLVLVAVAAIAYGMRNRILGVPVQTVQAAQRDLVQTVVASGHIVSPQRVSIGAAFTERVARIPVKEGQAVSRGAVLIELADEDERAALSQARAGIAQAEAKLRQLREVALPASEQSLAQAQANVVQSRQSFERNKALQAKGFIGQAALDEARRALDVAESQLRAAQLQVGSNAASGSEYAVARAALEQARATALAAQAKLDQMVIRAPVDGVLIARNVEPGNIVQAGKELMALAPAGETQIVVQMDERHLAQIAPGQKAMASADAFPGERFAAELVYINPGVDATRGSVEVKLRVPEPPKYLRQDMTVSVDIAVARRAAAQAVPSDAVRDTASRQPWVLALRDGVAVRLPVKVGLRGDGYTEIIEGIAAGEALIPATYVQVQAGQRVRTAGATTTANTNANAVAGAAAAEKK